MLHKFSSIPIIPDLGRLFCLCFDEIPSRTRGSLASVPYLWCGRLLPTYYLYSASRFFSAVFLFIGQLLSRPCALLF